MRKYKVLISDTAKLYPPLWGGPKRIWNIFSHLSEEPFDITYVGLDYTLKGKRYKLQRHENNFKEISCAFPAHYYPWHLFEKRVLKNATFDIFAYLLIGSDSHFRHVLNSLRADVLVASHPWAAPLMQKKENQLFIYDAHNCEYLLMKQILKGSWYKAIVSFWARKIEHMACKKSDIILVCSENEKKDFLKIYKVREDKIHIISNGAHIRPSIDRLEKEKAKEKLGLSGGRVISFIGAYYQPNIEAVRFIIDHLVPQLKEFTFLIAGSVAKLFDGKQLSPKVKLFSTVREKELSDIFSASNIAINPMFSGSGINIKMLDYMSFGLPIVTTAYGARGIETNGKRPMIISSADKFAENIQMLSSNERLSKQMGEDGRCLVAERYDWTRISASLQQLIMKKLS